jgi:predicted ATPase
MLDVVTASSQARRHLERVDWVPRGEVDLGRWPFTIPAVAQLVHDGGLEVPAGVSLLVGENGSGKSSLIEALAAAYPRPVTSPFARVGGPEPSREDSLLPRHLRARVHPMASPYGFFLRAEMMHGYFAGIDADPTQARAWDGQRLQERSHGESFLAVLRHRFADVGVYFLDEPEAALSFRSCLGLLALLAQLREEGSQVVVATHSPVLAALPGATLLEVGDWGLRQVAYDDLELVRDWRGFLDAPQRWLLYLLEEQFDEPAT